MADNPGLRELRAAVKAIKETTPCSDCKGYFHAAAMDFDHLDPSTKLDGVSRLVNAGMAKAAYLEMAKCELVCANCHRVRTYNRRYGLPQ